MTYPTITGPITTTATEFGGDVMNNISNLFNGVDITTGGNPNQSGLQIHKNFAFQFTSDGSSKSSLQIQDTTNSVNYSILTSAITAARTITLPLLTANDAFAMLAFQQTFTNKYLNSSSVLFMDNTDNTKKAQFSTTGITTGNTRTYTLPDHTDTIAVLGFTQTFSGAITFSGGITMSSANISMSNNAITFSGTTPSAGMIQFSSLTSSNAVIQWTSSTSTNAYPFFNLTNDTNTMQFGYGGTASSFPDMIFWYKSGVGIQWSLTSAGVMQVYGAAGFGSTVSTNNQISTGSQGSSSTTLYIGNKSITTSSDIRLKTDIHTWKGKALDLIDKLHVVDFVWNDPSDTAKINRNSRGRYMGFIAQEVIDLLPWTINAEDRTCKDCRLGNKCEKHPNYWQMEYEYVVPLLTKAVQELQTKVNLLESKI